MVSEFFGCYLLLPLLRASQTDGGRHSNLTASHVVRAENVDRMEAIAKSLIEQGCNAKTAAVTNICSLHVVTGQQEIIV